MKGHTGRIRTTTIIAKAGNVTRGIGTTRTTTTVIGATIIMGGGIAITTTATKPVESFSSRPEWSHTRVEKMWIDRSPQHRLLGQ